MEEKIEDHEKAETTNYCPTCFQELEELKGCGSLSYFCKTCNCLVSRKKIVSLEKK